MDAMTHAPGGGLRSLRNPEHWMVPPWPKSANAPEVVDHFMRFALRDDPTDLERLTYYEAYVGALETAHEHSTGLMRSAFSKGWYHDLHDALLRCVERYRQRCKETETCEQSWSAAERTSTPRDGEELP
ncbi:hypothetical protein ACTG9Q_28800 [Actinokineospora sp. 24-640]